jgi:DNA polymerase-1
MVPCGYKYYLSIAAWPQTTNGSRLASRRSPSPVSNSRYRKIHVPNLPKDNETTLFLIDGSSYIYRAYHAIRGLTTRDGFPTNAVYGFANMLLKVIRDHEPDHLAMVFDAPGPTFRHDQYPEYKATRPPMPDDLKQQLPRIDQVVEAFNIPVLRQPGVEADDIIATLAKRCAGQVNKVVIVSSDKDLMQLVGGNVLMLDTMKDKWIGPDEVEEKFGVGPDKLGDVLALMGDSSDNIPGMAGVGPKTAGKLIAQFGSVDKLLAHAGEVKGKVGERLPESADLIKLSRELVTLKGDLEMDTGLKELASGQPDTDALRELFEELQFTRLLNELSPRQALSREGYRTILTDEELSSLCEELKAAGGFAVDTETDGMDPMTAPLVGISLSWAEGQAVYIPLTHAYLGAPAQLSTDNVKEVLGPILADPGIRKIGQNIKYDLLVLEQAGFEVKGVWCDTMVASWLADPSRRSHGLSEISSLVLGHTMIEYREVAGSGKNQVSFSQVQVEDASTYSAEDADVTWRVAAPLLDELENIGLTGLFEDMEMPLAVLLAQMEKTGVLLDTGVLEKLNVELIAGLSESESKIYGEAGREFNINSPKQLSQILFNELGLPPVKKTKTGYSTNDEVLLELSEKHQLPAMIREYRSLAKLKSTYVDALPNMIHPVTGRVHTSFNQTATATGRLSSSDPNLQNIPVRTDLGRRIREAFVAPPGTVLLSADYSQIELRILAHLSGDQNLLDAFSKGEDIHGRTASQVFGAGEKVDPELRRRAKVINFGIIYGMSAYGLSKELGISPGEASGMIEDYFAAYSGVREYMDGLLEKAKEEGFVTTLFNRRRNLPELDSSNPNTRQLGERMAINTPIQGTAADVIKLAMLRVDEVLKKDMPDTRMILTVHDELIFEVPEKDVEKASGLISGIMEGVVDLDVPLVVDVGWGENWAKAH